MDENREPTVDDLRVKLCYICREEERSDGTLCRNPRATLTLMTPFTYSLS
jgi:hypothetical protein